MAMDRREFLVALDQALMKAFGGQGKVLGTIEGCPTCDVVFDTVSFAAFFCFVPAEVSVFGHWERAQGEIANLCHGERPWGRDLNLVLLAPQEQVRRELSEVRRVLDNRYTCRKFVLSLNGSPLQELLERLPFWPPESLLRGAGSAAGYSIRELLPGFDPSLVLHIASHSPGADSIARAILDGDKYQLDSKVTAVKAPGPRLARNTRSGRLTGLDIKQFRGIRDLTPATMPLNADVVVVYGPNGVGKTTIADAFEWVVTGEVKRLERFKEEPGTPDVLQSVFPQFASYSVTCHLNVGEPLRRDKTPRGAVTMIGGNRAKDNREAIDHVVGTHAPDESMRLAIGALRDLFRGSHLLCQSTMRDFLTITAPDERFNILTSMIGAEEFVRFRQKASAVKEKVRKLETDHITLAQMADQESSQFGEDIRRREEEFSELRAMLGAAASSEATLAEVVAIAARCGCSLPVGPEGPLVRQLEFARIQLEPLIASRRKAISFRISHLNEIARGLVPYNEDLAALTNLQAELHKREGLASLCDQAMLQIQERLSKVKESMQKAKDLCEKAQVQCSRLVWLDAKQKERQELGLKAAQLEGELQALREEAQRRQDWISHNEEALAANKQRLAWLRQEEGRLNATQAVAKALCTRLQQVEVQAAEISTLLGREQSLSENLNRLESAARAWVEKAEAADVEVAQLGAREASLERMHGQQKAAMSRLAEMVKSPACPLCGTQFHSVKALADAVHRQLEAVPSELTQIQGAKQAAMRKAEDVKNNRTLLEGQCESMRREKFSLAQRRNDLQRYVTGFLAECASAGIVLPEDQRPSWRNNLEAFCVSNDPCRTSTEIASCTASLADLERLSAEGESDFRRLCGQLRTLESQLAGVRFDTQRIDQEIEARGLDASICDTPGKLQEGMAEAQNSVNSAEKALADADLECKEIERQSQQRESLLAAARGDIMTTRHAIEVKHSEISGFESLLEQTNIPRPVSDKTVREALSEAEMVLKELDTTEEMRQGLSRFARLEELTSQLDILKAQLTAKRQVFEAAREKASKLNAWVRRLCELEREAASQQMGAVGAHLESLEPAIDLIYKRLNTHPFFGSVRVRVDQEQHTVRILAASEDNNIEVHPPGFFSDAQLNMLAISVFLAGALRQRWSALETILIDDPIQQLDEMNVCAFLDLIRGLLPSRQFIIFTCSRDFYLLSIDKFSPLNTTKSDTFKAYRLESREPGCLLVHSDVPPRDTDAKGDSGTGDSGTCTKYS